MSHVEPHALELTVWDVPPTAVAGERFTLSVGARCSAGCNLGGRALSLFDQHGVPAGTANLRHEVCPGTEALHFAQLEVTAARQAGSHAWEAKIEGWDGDLPHATGAFPLTVRIVPAPDCEVTVRAVDRESQTPIAGACVVMHPYRAVTGEDGTARVKVARGPYEVLVSGSGYVAACITVEVSADMFTSAALDAQPPWTSPDEDAE